MSISLQDPFNDKQETPAKALSRQELDSLRYAILRCVEDAGFRLRQEERLAHIIKNGSLMPHANMYVDGRIVTRSFSNEDEVHDIRLFQSENREQLKKVATNQTWVLDAEYDEEVSMLNMSFYVYDPARRLHLYEMVVESAKDETNLKLIRITKSDTALKKGQEMPEVLEEFMKSYNPEEDTPPQMETVFEKTFDTSFSNDQLCEQIGNSFLKAFKENISKQYFELEGALRNWKFSQKSGAKTAPTKP